jgi:hypothetical protein
MNHERIIFPEMDPSAFHRHHAQGKVVGFQPDLLATHGIFLMEKQTVLGPFSTSCRHPSTDYPSPEGSAFVLDIIATGHYTLAV